MKLSDTEKKSHRTHTQAKYFKRHKEDIKERRRESFFWKSYLAKGGGGLTKGHDDELEDEVELDENIPHNTLMNERKEGRRRCAMKYPAPNNLKRFMAKFK